MGMKNVAAITVVSLALAGCATADNADEIVLTGAKAERSAEVPPPPRQEILLEEIRNLLAKQQG